MAFCWNRAFAVVLVGLLWSAGGCRSSESAEASEKNPVPDIQDRRIQVAAPEPPRASAEDVPSLRERERARGMSGGMSVAAADIQRRAGDVARTAGATAAPSDPATDDGALSHASATAPSTAPSGPYGAERFRLINQSDEIVSVLKNGLTVIVKRVSSPVVAVRGYVYTGGVYEGRWLGGGLSHLLEHLVAGGSSQRRSEAANRDLLQEIGNNSNAYTTFDHTAYFINTTPPHLSKAVDLVTGWMLGALITPAEYRREYQVVQRELEKDKGEPDWVFYELTMSNRYRVNPARVPVIGYQEVIQSLTRDDVFNYYKTAYQPNNMVFAVTGDLEPEKMLDAVRRYVSAAKPGREFNRDIPDEPPVLAPRTLVATFPKLGQARLEIAFPSVRLSSPDLYALDLLSAILADGESSILVEELRDRQRLVNAIGASNPTPTYVAGSFQIDMELDPAKIQPATDALMKVLDDIIKSGVAPDRIQRAKVQMRTGRVKSMQTSEDIASSLATDLMNTGDPHFTDRYIKRIEQVTPEQIQAAAKKYFVRQRMLTTALLPAEYVGAGGLPKAEDILRPVAPTTKESATQETAGEITRAELPNGTILLHKRIPTSPLVAIRMFSLGGVTAEDAKTNGLGNLTMEMLSRGTGTRSAQQIAEFFDSIGGDFDASCGNNTWGWSATCLKADFDKTMDVFADVVNHPSFPADEAKLVKQRTLAAIASQDADWRAQAMRFFKQAFFAPEHSPYQFLPIGVKQNVAAFDVPQMKQWYTQKVLSARRVIAIFGDVPLDSAKKIVMEKLGSGASVNAATQLASPDAAATSRGSSPDKSASGAATGDEPSVTVTAVKANKTEQPLAGIFIGYDANPIIGDPANYPIDVADTMASGWGYPTGYIFEILRGRGLVYDANAQNIPGRSAALPGTFLVYAACDPQKVNEVIDVLLENIARLQGTARDMQPAWFGRSKQLITTSDAMENETPAAQAMTAALDELMGLGYNYHDQFPARINAVSLEDVRHIAAQRLRKCLITVSTPAPELIKVEPGTRTYKSFPPVDLTPRGVQHDVNGK